MTEREIRRHLTEHAEALYMARTVARRMESADISVVDGVVMMSPVSLEHSDTHDDLVVQLRPQARSLGLRLAGDVQFMHPAWPDPFCPDVAVWEPPAGLAAKPLDAAAILLAIEIVSVSSVENDYVIKDRQYREARIPAYLLLDPYTRTWRLRTEPASSAWGRISTGKYDEQLTVPLPSGEVLEIDTLTFPETPYGSLRDHWPAHRIGPSEDY